MSSSNTLAGDSMLSFKDLVPGIIERLPQMPHLAKSLWEMQKLSSSMEQINSIGLLLEKNAVDYPEKRALLYEDKVYTHAEVNAIVNQYANYFISQGIQKGDVIGVLLENRPELIFIISALGKIGAISALMNPNQRGKILLHSIQLTCKIKFIVGEEMLAPFTEILPEIEKTITPVLYFLPDGTDEKAPDGFIDLPSMIRGQSSGNPETTQNVMLKDPYAYVFTSGTTGLPKATVQLHFKWIGGGKWFGKINMNLTPDDNLYIPLPLYHTNGLSVAWPAAVATGGAMSLRRKFSASNFLSDVRKFNATSFIYIGEVCRYLMNQPEKPDDHENPLKKMIGNGLRPDIWKSFKKRFGISHIYELYGAAEGGSIFTNFLNIDCSVGSSPTPFAIVEYDIGNDEIIKNENGFFIKVQKGKPGLLLTKISKKSPFIGYTSKHETNKKILTDVFKKGDTWFNTGDLMRTIGFRHVQFVDRLGDTFRWKGENVSTTEVEEIVNQVDGIEGATVYGVRIPGTEGRAGMVSIIRQPEVNGIHLKQLAEKLKASLPGYAVPIFLREKSQFNTTATHKIIKYELKSEGFSPDKVTDPLFIMLPGEENYSPLTPEVYQKIIDGEFRF